MKHMMSLIEKAEASKVGAVRELGMAARNELIKSMEWDEPNAAEAALRCIKAVEKEYELDVEYPGTFVTGAFIIAECSQVNGDTRISTRQWGCMNLPHTRIGALQMVTSHQMQNFLG